MTKKATTISPTVIDEVRKATVAPELPTPLRATG
jgi:hypothetical protein